jgi:hypothetical protein
MDYVRETRSDPIYFGFREDRTESTKIRLNTRGCDATLISGGGDERGGVYARELENLMALTVLEAVLRKGRESSRGTSKLSWNKAKKASRDAWDRIERALPGDSDRDGKFVATRDEYWAA